MVDQVAYDHVHNSLRPEKSHVAVVDITLGDYHIRRQSRIDVGYDRENQIYVFNT